MNSNQFRNQIGEKKRIVVKIGSSSLTHTDTGKLDLIKLETFVRELTDLRNQGKDVILVTSGAVMVGRDTIGLHKGELNLTEKQACASIGQAKLMMIYQKLFSEYNQVCSQILMTKNTMLDNLNRINAKNTFRELLSFGVIPVVNENDTIATYEIDNLSTFGDNDTLSAVVAAMVEADLLILLSDIDGLYTDDPHKTSEASFIECVEKIDDHLLEMGKDSTGSESGTGGMATKLTAARIATAAGADMIIASGEDVHILHRIMRGDPEGTLFMRDRRDALDLLNYLEKIL